MRLWLSEIRWANSKIRANFATSEGWNCPMPGMRIHRWIPVEEGSSSATTNSPRLTIHRSHATLCSTW